MALTSSLNFNPKIKPEKIKTCLDCGLYQNQSPAFDEAGKSEIFWVGLSAVRFKGEDKKSPLAPNTKSGALIETIEKPLKDKLSFYKTNIVKCLPLKEGKIRYPIRKEMEKCSPHFEVELDRFKPSVIFLLGRHVTTFVLNKNFPPGTKLSKSFDYEHIRLDNMFFVPVHHPSYILIYERKRLNQYVNSLRRLCQELLQD